MNRPFDLVIFDCDGVLVDSERLTNSVFADLLRAEGLSFTLDEMFEHFVGRTSAECMSKVEAMLGRPPPADFLDCYKERCREVLTTELKVVCGVREVLAGLLIPSCVASSGEVEKMQLTLGSTGLLEFFEGSIFSVVAERVRPKPNPDIFLLAASRIGAEPDRCVVIEDTPTGVAGGVAAGMTVFGYAELMRPERLLEAGAHRVFSDMAELPGMLTQG